MHDITAHTFWVVLSLNSKKGFNELKKPEMDRDVYNAVLCYI